METESENNNLSRNVCVVHGANFKIETFERSGVVPKGTTVAFVSYHHQKLVRLDDILKLVKSGIISEIILDSSLSNSDIEHVKNHLDKNKHQFGHTLQIRVLSKGSLPKTAKAA